MRKILLFIFLLLHLSSCVERTVYGDCVGFFEDKEPNLKYRISINNAAVSFLLVETIIVPVLWGANYVYCPTGEKKNDK